MSGVETIRWQPSPPGGASRRRYAVFGLVTALVLLASTAIHDQSRIDPFPTAVDVPHGTTAGGLDGRRVEPAARGTDGGRVESAAGTLGGSRETIPMEEERSQPRAVDGPAKPEATWASQQPYYRIASAQIRETLGDYEGIPIAVPAGDPLGAAPGGSGAQRAALQVRTPYWINTSANEGLQARNVAGAPSELQKLFRQFPIAVRQGKGTPSQIQAAVGTAVGTGQIRSPSGAWPPGRAEIERWMAHFGIGLDCSGFVYEALARIDRALVEGGTGGLLRPLGGPPTYVGSMAIAKGGDRLAAPAALSPGDVMYLAPDGANPIGHIRIVDDVQLQGQGAVFHTAETTAAGAGGPTARWWRFPDASRFDRLEEFSDGRWRPGEEREQSALYARRLPSTPSGSPSGP